MFSASTCGPRIHGGEVLCYDVPAPTDEVAIAPKDDAGYLPGSMMSVEINAPTYDRYEYIIEDASKNELLKGLVVQPEERTYHFIFDVKLDVKGYTGPARIIVNGLYKSEDGNEGRAQVFSSEFKIGS